MRIATYVNNGKPAVGLVAGESILDLKAGFERAKGAAPASVQELIEGGQAMLDKVRKVLDGAIGQKGDAALWRPLKGTTLLAPIPAPLKNVFCVGRYYKLHIEEGHRARGTPVVYPSVPEFFTKPRTTVVGPDADVRLDPAVTRQLDYEVELAIVIGRQCRDVKAARAGEAIFGYTIVNDVTGRDLQAAHGQWFKGKALDTCGPMGPWIVTADAYGDPGDKRLSLRVNGETRQDSTTGDLLFDCATIVEHLSRGMTLDPGDVVATGTPSGVALGMVPQVWLKGGDVMEAEVEGIGILRNTVRQIG